MYLVAAFFAASVCMTVVVTSCDKEENIESGIVTITTSSSECTIGLWGSGTATIDWGDGTESETVALMREQIILSHTYSGISNRNITVSGKISGFICRQNQIINLDVSKHKGLIYLGCDGNQLTNLDVSKNTGLKYLTCAGNQLTNLDVSKNSNLQELQCNDNQLTNLDVSGAVKLTLLNCYNNQLSGLNVTKNTLLKFSDCSGNQLKNLDISKNTRLECITCYNNLLTSLDVSKNIELFSLYCMDNQLNTVALNALFGTLPIRDPNSDYNGYINIVGNPGAYNCNKEIATTRKWIVYY